MKAVQCDNCGKFEPCVDGDQPVSWWYINNAYHAEKCEPSRSAALLCSTECIHGYADKAEARRNGDAGE